MSNLLYANFSRLWKTKMFIIGLGFMFFAGSFLVWKQYGQIRDYGIPVTLENTFFAYTLIISIVSAIFCSLFIGVEYSDGTIRNKIIVGHKRIDIYFANLIVNICASLLMCLSYILSNIIVGIPLIGPMNIGITKVLMLIGGSMATIIALCSIFTMVSLLIQNKAIAPVICIVGMFIMIGFISVIQTALNQPKFWYDGTYNPNYVDGAKRERYETLYTALPAGQAMQYIGMNTKNMNEICMYSAGLTIITTGVGIFLFKKKDIK